MAATAAVTVLIVVLIHKSTKAAITGCVNSGENGMTLIDADDDRSDAPLGFLKSLGYQRRRALTTACGRVAPLIPEI